MKVDGAISSLIQGVSQQPDRERLPGQCELQINCSSDPVNGLNRRGPLDYVGQLLSSASAYTFSDYDAGSIGQFEIAHRAGEIKVFNLDGTENTVTVDGDADDYIPSGELNFIGIDENIYLVDPNKTVEMLPDVKSYVQGTSIAFFLGGEYGRDYSMTITWKDSMDVEYVKKVIHSSVDGSSAEHIEEISTGYLATQIVNAFRTANVDGKIETWDRTADTIQLDTNPGYATEDPVEYVVASDDKEIGGLSEGTTYYVIDDGLENGKQKIRLATSAVNAAAGTDINLSGAGDSTQGYGGIVAVADKTTVNDTFDIERVDDVLYVTAKGAADVEEFTISVDDSNGGVNFIAVNNKVSDVGNLPRYAPQGYIVKVEESGTASADDWYLEFQSDTDGVVVGDGFGDTGVWLETVAPDTEYRLDPATMPHVLEKTGPTAFTLKQGTWDERASGDDDTNPLPSFVGNTINDIGSFQGRLAFTSDVNLILSRTNKHTSFFRQSATTLADDDPIDIASSLGTFVLKKMVPHNRDLIIFSDRVQFIMFGRNVITPTNSSLVLTTEFEADLDIRPVGAGRNIFFGFKYGNYLGIHEFFTDGGEDVNDSRPITQHVSEYIEGNGLAMASTTNFNKLVVRTDADKKVVYLYEYIWLNGEKVQSSWSQWNFHADVEHMFFVDNTLYVTIKDGESYELYTLNLDDTADTGLDYRVSLDQKIKRTSVNTSFTVPYAIDDIDNYIAVQGANCPNPGLRVLIESESSGTITLEDDMEGGDVYFGRKYLSRYIPTSPFVRDRDGVKVGSGKLTIKKYVVHFNDTGYFKAVISDDYEYSAEVEYNGRILGSPENLIGNPAVQDGSYSIPYKQNADTSQIEFQSDSHLPFAFTELEWNGQWRKKGRRITGG